MFNLCVYFLQIRKENINNERKCVQLLSVSWAVNYSVIPASQHSTRPFYPSLLLLFCRNSQSSFFNFPPFSVVLLYNNSHCLLFTPFSVPPPREAEAPEEINCPSVNVILSQEGGWGGEREMREDELPLRVATSCSALLCWEVVMEELWQRHWGLPTDQVTDAKSACPTQRNDDGGQRCIEQSRGTTNRAHTERARWTKIRPNSTWNAWWTKLAHKWVKGLVAGWNG